MENTLKFQPLTYYIGSHFDTYALRCEKNTKVSTGTVWCSGVSCSGETTLSLDPDCPEYAAVYSFYEQSCQAVAALDHSKTARKESLVGGGSKFTAKYDIPAPPSTVYNPFSFRKDPFTFQQIGDKPTILSIKSEVTRGRNEPFRGRFTIDFCGLVSRHFTDTFDMDWGIVEIC